MARTLDLPFFKCIVWLFFMAGLLSVSRSALGQEAQLLLMDVGEGASQLLITEEGKACLIDTGNPISGIKILKTLREKKLSELECIIITHPHPDHMGGLFTILGLIRTKKIYDNGQPIPKRPLCDLMRWYEELVRNRANYFTLRAGDIITLSKSIRISVLWPRKDVTLSPNWNENSLVLLIGVGSKRILIMGDATKKVEQKILATTSLGKIKGLVVGHHGADDATSRDFLAAIKPTWAYISIDVNNIRGYPSKNTLTRLKNTGILILKSYINGTCTLFPQEPITCSKGFSLSQKMTQ